MSDLELQNQSEVMIEKPKREKKEPKRFGKLMSFLLIFLALIIGAGGSYFGGKYYFVDKLDKDRIKQQLAFYEQKVKAEPNNSKNLVSLGYTYFLMGNNDKAISQFNQAIDVDSKYFDAYYNLGLVYNDENRLDDALQNFQKAVDLSPRDYKGHMQKGMVYRKMKMYEDAYKELNQANKLMPAHADIIYETGRVSEDMGKKNEAIQLYKDALSYDPLYQDAIKALDRVQKSK